MIWRVLQLTPDTPPETLLAYADPRYSTSPFALDLLIIHPFEDGNGETLDQQQTNEAPARCAE